MLQTAGHDAATVYGGHMSGRHDKDLLEACRVEGRAVITLDRGFGDLRKYSPESHEGIVILRPGSAGTGTVLALVARMLPSLQSEPMQHRLWIVTEDRIRIRPR